MWRWLRRLSAIFSIAVLGLVMGLSSFGFGLEQNYGLRWLFYIRGAKPPSSEVLIVGIDDQSGPRLGLSKLPRDWPRSVHARLVDELVRLGASVIVFDFDFQTPKQQEDDLAFAKAISSSNRVVLTEKLIGKRQPVFDTQGQQKGALWVEQLVAPMPILAEAAKGAGTFPLPKLDVAVHEFWAFKQGIEYAPTTPAVALQLHAQKVHPDLVSVIKNKLSYSAELPTRIEKTDKTPEIRRLMIQLRQAFEQSDLDLSTPAEIHEKPITRNMDNHETSLLNALIGLYSESDHRYLNFYGPPGTIKTIPYYTLLEKNDKSPKNIPDLSGKVVFVGYSDLYDPSQPDRFYTVFTNQDGVDLSGVEIAATAFSNLLSNQSLTTPPTGLLALILFIFGAIISGMAYSLPALVSIPVSLIMASVYIVLAEKAFEDHYLWLPLAVPLMLQLPIALFTGLGAEYLSERRKKKRATQAISFYLPEKLANDFTEKNLESTALNKVTYSVCFASDMAGFTSISEKLPPKELAVFLNGYFETLSSPLRKHQVDVIEFRADGIMCAWTAENNFPNIHHQAALAALDAVEAIAEFSKVHPILTQPLRIGLEAGMVYVGHSGGGGHFVYSIVGDSANTAARIEGLNKKLGTQILASRRTLEGINDILTRYLGDFQFVGKTEALPIVELMARKDQATDSQHALSMDYQIAIEKLATGDCSQALILFESILEKHPDDGPAKFHKAYCQKLLTQQESLPTNPSIIQLDSK